MTKNINKGVIFLMKNQTKLLSKSALLLVTVGAGIALASAHHVSVHADTWQNNVEHVGAHNLKETNQQLTQQIRKSQEAKKVKNSFVSTNDALDRVMASDPIQNAKREAKLFKAKSTAEYKKLNKKAKKEIKKYEHKHAKSKKLFRIKVKAHKVYTYVSTKLRKEGRKIEKKGATLWVSGIIKKGSKTFYKLFNGKVIPASKHFVEKLSK